MKFTTRKIYEDDLEKIMRWRMDPDITKWMNTDPILTLEGQKKWLEKIIEDKSCKYWMIEVDDRPVGVVNLVDLDFKLKQGMWGYYVGEKESRSLKLAISLEVSLYCYFFEKLCFERLYNEILTINQGVIQLHKMCGNIVEKELKKHVLKNGEWYDVTRMLITKEIWDREKDNFIYDYIEFGE